MRTSYLAKNKINNRNLAITHLLGRFHLAGRHVSLQRSVKGRDVVWPFVKLSITWRHTDLVKIQIIYFQAQITENLWINFQKNIYLIKRILESRFRIIIQKQVKMLGHVTFSGGLMDPPFHRSVFRNPRESGRHEKRTWTAAVRRIIVDLYQISETWRFKTCQLARTSYIYLAFRNTW